MWTVFSAYLVFVSHVLDNSLSVTMWTEYVYLAFTYSLAEESAPFLSGLWLGLTEAEAMDKGQINNKSTKMQQAQQTHNKWQKPFPFDVHKHLITVSQEQGI